MLLPQGPMWRVEGSGLTSCGVGDEVIVFLCVTQGLPRLGCRV